MKKSNLRIGKSIITTLVLSTSMMSLTGVTFAAQVTNDAPPSVTIQGVTWYQISTAAQLEYIDQNQGNYLNANIELMNNLDLTGFAWTPFGTPFSGTFNGQGYGVSGVTVDEPSSDYVGFFGTNSGTVENFHVNGSMIGHDEVGSLVGIQNGGTITDSYATGSVQGANFVGGLVGILRKQGTISDSYATGTVTSNKYAGGLVGLDVSSSIADSYATGSVTGSLYTGGLVGLVSMHQSGGSITNSYFDTTTTGQSQGVSNFPQSTITSELDTAMKTEATFSSWDFAKTWGISSAINHGYPYLLNDHSFNGGGLVGQMPEVPLAGVLPLLGLAGVGVFWLRRRQSVK